MFLLVTPALVVLEDEAPLTERVLNMEVSVPNRFNKDISQWVTVLNVIE